MAAHQNGIVPAGAEAITEDGPSLVSQVKVKIVRNMPGHVEYVERYPLPQGKRILGIVAPCPTDLKSRGLLSSLRGKLCPVSREEIRNNKIPGGAYVVLKGRNGGTGHVVIEGVRSKETPSYTSSDIQDAYVSCQ